LLTDEDGNLKTILTDGTTDIAVCAECQALVVIDADHKMIQDSNMWVSSYLKAGLLAAGSFFIHLKVPADSNPHVSFFISVEAECSWFFYENPTLTNDGTALSEVSVNRQDVGVSGMQVYRDPVITGNGTLLETGKIGGGNRVRAAGGTTQGAGWWLLKKSESYLVRVDNDDGVARDISIAIKWHES